MGWLELSYLKIVGFFTKKKKLQRPVTGCAEMSIVNSVDVVNDQSKLLFLSALDFRYPL